MPRHTYTRDTRPRPMEPPGVSASTVRLLWLAIIEAQTANEAGQAPDPVLSPLKHPGGRRGQRT
jgi:hypothetical protein